MARVNEHYLELQGNYLFAEVARRVTARKEALSAAGFHPQKVGHCVSLGIGDVTHPLVPALVSALHEAVEEMGQAASFHGYGPEQGYGFLREAIAHYEYASRGAASVDPSGAGLHAECHGY